MAKFIVNGEDYETNDPQEIESLRADPDVPEIHERAASVSAEIKVS